MIQGCIYYKLVYFFPNRVRPGSIFSPIYFFFFACFVSILTLSMTLNWLTVHWKHKQSLKALNQCLKKFKNANIHDFFTYSGPILFPRPIFFRTPMARTLCTIYIPVWIKKKISFYSWKKQEPVSIVINIIIIFWFIIISEIGPNRSVLKLSILIVQKLTIHQNGAESC